MGNAFTALFAALAALFKGTEQFASAFNNIGEWTNESSKVFVDEARHKRAELIKRQAMEAAATQAIAAPAATPAP